MTDRLLLTRAFGPPNSRLGCWAEGVDRTLTFPAQPRNTWSNVSYVLSGLVLHQIAGSVETLLFMLAMAALTLGSAAFHAWPTDTARRGWAPLSTRQADHAPMHAVAAVVLLATLGLAPWMIASGAILSTGLAFVTDRVSIPVALMLGGALAVDALGGGVRPWTVVGLALIAISYGAWRLDRHQAIRWKADKRRKRWLGKWGHALWHWGTGPGLACLMAGAVR